jgi:hypothetical protein
MAGGFFVHRLKDGGIEVVIGLFETHGYGEIILAEAKQIIDVDTSSGTNEDVLRFGGAR